MTFAKDVIGFFDNGEMAMSKEAMLVSMARLVTETTWEQIPEKEKLWARLAFCDFTAVALAGSTVPVVQNLHRWLQS